MAAAQRKVDPKLKADKVKETVDAYSDMWNETNEGAKEQRKEKYTTLVNQYYDLTTDFYEFGWGTSFHFGRRHRNESLEASISRHEHFIALKLQLKPGMRILDVGCGVGGPMMEIARFSGASITGLNNNAYQISRGQKYVEQNGLEDICGFMKADFMKIPVPDNSYDGVYAIEATCHAPSKVGIYSEIFRVLKPGAMLFAYEWCMTDKYDPTNPDHQKIKKQIEVGDGLPDIDSTSDVVKALQDCKFEILDYKDLAITEKKNPIAWYEPLLPGLSLSGFRVTSVGKWATHGFVSILETVGLAPKGSSKTHSVLMEAHEGLSNGGKLGVFTPMFYFLVRKPKD